MSNDSIYYIDQSGENMSFLEKEFDSNGRYDAQNRIT
jgi:hypothetical protein